MEIAGTRKGKRQVKQETEAEEREGKGDTVKDSDRE